MFIRFATLLKDPYSAYTAGMLVVAHALREGGDLSAAEYD